MHKFTYHAIGQGLFFDAVFKIDEDKHYNFVYDCGAVKSHLPNLKNKIKKYKKGISHIDMLVISHFDYDHISGLMELMKNNMVTNVVMPYLIDDEILMYLLSQKDKIPKNEEWYYNFLNNPIEFLAEYNDVEKITLIVSSDEYLNRDLVEQSAESSSRDSTDEFQENKKKIVRNTWLLNIESEIPLSYREINYNNMKIELRSDLNDYLKTDKLKFRFFNYPISYQKRALFRRKISQYIYDNNLSNKDWSYIGNFILSDVDKVKNFKSMYEYIIKDHNNVSLLVSYEYNTPEGFNTIKLIKTCMTCVESNEELLNYTNKIVHLLTGDISIKYKRKHLKVYDHYSDQLSYMNFIQVPHHGSHHNWNSDLLAKVSNNTHFVVSSGGMYNHPHNCVVKSIRSGHRLFRANQYTEIKSIIT